MATIYIEAFLRSEEEILFVSLESLIVIQIFKLCLTENITLCLLPLSKSSGDEPLFGILPSNLCHNKVCLKEVPDITNYCTWPTIVVGNTIVAGLTSVCRQIIKSSNNKEAQKYLGFREACLIACNESSPWTKFCEIDMIHTVKTILKNLPAYIDDNIFKVPIDLTRFENHMRQPVKMHNIYKLARIKNKDKSLKSSVPVEQLNLDHKFAEGPFITLADVILLSCFKILFKIFDLESLKMVLPFSIKWYDIVLNNLKEAVLDFTMIIDLKEPVIVFDMSQEAITNRSLYKSVQRDKPQNQIYTKQSDLEKSLANLTGFIKNCVNEKETFGHDSYFSWDEVPFEANPLGGALPDSRAARKCQQLENLAKATIKLAGNKSNIIVDFCSGSGHLGILIASVLPNSHVILVENKERSLSRAHERIRKMNLNNVTLVQSNLDYFIGKFNIGLALHACGVATDLVIQNCIKNKADFVCCPCCYGNIHDCHHLKYPRSTIFKQSLTYKDYLIVGHSADQTHDKGNTKTAQGYLCMNVIDTDRKLYAEEAGYTVHLGKLIPVSCTPKNNLLVGLYHVH